MTQEEAIKLRQEMRELRQRIAQAQRGVEVRDRRLASSEEEKLELKKRCAVFEKENETLKEQNKKLAEQLAAMQEHKDKLAGFLFKTNQRKHKEDSGADTQDNSGKKRGGQSGHAGQGKSLTSRIDQEQYVFLTHCPECKNQVSRTSSTYTRLVEDLPEIKPVVTKYTIERQWCSTCQKEVCVTPPQTIPRCRLGVGAIAFILTLKYRLGTPLKKIREFLNNVCGIKLSEGGIQRLFHGLQKRFHTPYQNILSKIRASSVKHADETSWRVEGKNAWAWAFATQEEVLYTIEETRGKGIPQRVLTDNPIGILVHDDYGGYQKIPMLHQSCFAHLIRVCREAASRPEASQEVLNLNEEVKTLYRELAGVVSEPFDQQLREKQHASFSVRLASIVNHNYSSRDAQKIQTRITHQKNNLLTALLHPNVPLTNNHAERQIRPLVITRKISGGSQSLEGARTHAVLMSLIQTISLKRQDFFTEVKQLLRAPEQWGTTQKTV